MLTLWAVNLKSHTVISYNDTSKESILVSGWSITGAVTNDLLSTYNFNCQSDITPEILATYSRAVHKLQLGF